MCRKRLYLTPSILDKPKTSTDKVVNLHQQPQPTINNQAGNEV